MNGFAVRKISRPTQVQIEVKCDDARLTNDPKTNEQKWIIGILLIKRIMQNEIDR